MKYLTRPTSLLSLAFLLVSSGAFAIPVQTGTTDFTLNIDTDLQFRLENSWGGVVPTLTGAAPSGHLNIDFFLRRASLAVRGTAFQVFTYYIKLETGRFGARGNYTTASQLQDVVLGYVPVTDVHIEGGFLKTPLSRPAVDSSPQTNTLEGVSDILMYPNARAQRQNGLQVRALLFERLFLIRGGFYEGARTGSSGALGNPPYINPNGWPMVAGMARLNIIGYEDNYTYPAIHLDGKNYMSAGVGAQYQPHSGALNADGTFNDYVALAADFYLDLALSGDNEVKLILDGYRFDYGAGAAKTGFGTHGEAGYRWGPIEPQLNYYWFNSDTKVNSFLRLAGGLNIFIHKHNAKIMMEYQNTIQNGVLPNQPDHPTTPWLHQFLVQWQLAI